MMLLKVALWDWLSLDERRESRDLLNPKKYVESTDTGHFSFLEAQEKAASIIKPRRQISKRSLTLDNCHDFFVNL